MGLLMVCHNQLRTWAARKTKRMHSNDHSLIIFMTLFFAQFNDPDAIEPYGTLQIFQIFSYYIQRDEESPHSQYKTFINYKTLCNLSSPTNLINDSTI